MFGCLGSLLERQTMNWEWLVRSVPLSNNILIQACPWHLGTCWQLLFPEQPGQANAQPAETPRSHTARRANAGYTCMETCV